MDSADFAARMARADRAWLLMQRVTWRIDGGRYREYPAARRFWARMVTALWRVGLMQGKDAA